jgi:AAA family ATP:ADP antiporter
MLRLIERLTPLQRRAGARGSLLFLYSFLIMASYVVARVTRDTLFLDEYSPDKLPLADLTIALLVGFVMSAYVSVSRYVTLRNLLVGSLLFFASNTFLFWWLARFHSVLAWPYPLLYVWVGLFGVLAPAQVWTLGNYALTPREAKRVFSVMAGGSILGGVFGGKVSSLMAPVYGTSSLLLGVGTALLISAVLVMIVWKKRPAEMLDQGSEETQKHLASPAVGESLKLIWSRPYLRALAALVLVANTTTSMAGWQFKALARTFYRGPELAAFFGDFYFYAGLAALLVQVVVTGYLLKRFGLGPALLVVPAAICFVSIGVLGWGLITIWAAIGLRSCMNVLQYSIDRPSAELLYLPVPAEIKNPVKSFVDTVVWRFGDGSAAVIQALFLGILGWQAIRAVQASWITMTLAVIWLVMAVVVYRRYVAALRDIIRQYRLDAEKAFAPVLDRSTSAIFAANLMAADPTDILYGLKLFEVSHRGAIHPAIRALLAHSIPEVRQKAILALSAAHDKSVRTQIEALLKDPSLGVRTEALLYLTHHAHIDPLTCIRELGDFSDFSVRSAMVAFLACPGETQNLVAARTLLEAMVREGGSDGKRTRLEAARLLSTLPSEFSEQLRKLLEDTDPDIVREAMRSVGNLRARIFVCRLIDQLADSELAPDAAEALAKFGDHLVGTLRDYLVDTSCPLEARRRIIGVLARIGTPAAEQVLMESLLEPDTGFRFRIISALNKLQQSQPDLPLDKQMIETVLAAEILGHYRSFQILGMLEADLNSEETVARARRQSMQDEIERIFRLLSLLLPNYDFHSAYVGLQSTSGVVRDTALEFLDNVLKPQLRDALIPLIDRDVSDQERIRLASRMVGMRCASREEAVAALLDSEDSWLRSCGAYAVGRLGLRQFEFQLDAYLNHPDALLRETAGNAKLRLQQLAPVRDLTRHRSP